MSTYPPDPRRSGPSNEDPEAHLVAALVAGGMGLMEACGYVWGNRTPDAATSVRIGYAIAVTWLRLPPAVGPSATETVALSDYRREVAPGATGDLRGPQIERESA